MNSNLEEMFFFQIMWSHVWEPVHMPTHSDHLVMSLYILRIMVFPGFSAFILFLFLDIYKHPLLPGI